MTTPEPNPARLDRRSFLKASLAVPAAAAALPALFARALRAAEPGDGVLVLVQLDGGNDGLNTVIPFADDAYYRARPGLGVPAAQVAKLSDHVGLHPSLSALRAAWDDDALAVIQAVGYPDSSRSHFTSTDVWHTAATDPQGRWTGWIGRTLDRDAAREVPALQLDPGPLSLALVGEKVVVPAVADAERFQVPGDAALLAKLAAREREGGPSERIRRSALQAYRTSARIEDALRDGRGRDAYPGTDLARRLWQVARLVHSGFPARVYAVRLSGFDTHARQAAAHAQLLKVLGDALAAFHADLKSSGLSDRVLTMTYSEFGRRVEENRSLGTDHGAAAPLFVLGTAVKGGLVNEHPSLTDLDGNGDLKHATDFRQVYATVLQRWLLADAAAVLGHPWPPCLDIHAPRRP